MKQWAEVLRSSLDGGELWEGFACVRFHKTPEELERLAELEAQDDREIASSLRSFVHSAREALRHQDFEGYQCYMDLAEEYSAEVSRRAEEQITYKQTRRYVYRCGCFKEETVTVHFKRDEGTLVFEQAGRCLDCLRQDLQTRKEARRLPPGLIRGTR